MDLALECRLSVELLQNGLLEAVQGLGHPKSCVRPQGLSEASKSPVEASLALIEASQGLTVASQGENETSQGLSEASKGLSGK